MYIFWDWCVRVSLFIFFGFIACIAPFWAWDGFNKPYDLAESSWFKWGWDWIEEIIKVVVKLSFACIMGYLAVMVLITRSEFRQKHEGTIKPCPTCGQDYHPKR